MPDRSSQGDSEWVRSIYRSLREKSTRELLRIWTENDREEWSERAFAAVRRVLVERGVALPAQEAAEQGAPPAPPSGAPRPDLVSVARFPTPIEAELARLSVEAFGIAAVVVGDIAATTTYAGGEADPVRLLVSKRQAREAHEILEREAASRRVPTELVAASAPGGLGTELEAAPPPEGRGIELEAMPGPGRGTELEAAPEPNEAPPPPRRPWWRVWG
ncbi:MAG: hypothetical protein HY321_19585 [Armatimonadetes bacterium]|nr:hypothetical protein [Armatimonadota bacterium]